MNDTNTDAQGSGLLINPGALSALEETLDKAKPVPEGMLLLSAEARADLNTTLATAMPQTVSMLLNVLTYMNQTGPHSNLAGGVGARMHIALYRNLQNYANNGPADFRKGFGALLRIVADQKKSGAFSPRYIFRFVKDMNLGTKDRQGLEVFFEAMVALSDGSSRAQALKQVDLSKVSSLCLNATGAQRYIGFFSA